MANGNGGSGRGKYKTKGGKIVPGVTTVTGMLGLGTRGLMWWAFEGGKRCGIETGLEYGYLAGKNGVAQPTVNDVDCEVTLNDFREPIADAGKLAHAMAQADIQEKPIPTLEGVDPKVAAKAKDSFESYRAWKERTKIELIASEVKLISEKHMYGGRTDAIVRFAGAPGILDFKSGKDLYDETIVQVAAYSEAWSEMKPDLATTHHHVLRWGPDGSFTHHALATRQIEVGWRMFQHALEVYRLVKQMREAA